MTSAACSDAPRAADQTIELTEARSYAASDSLNDIRGIALGRQSDLWVVGSPAPFIHRYDSTGKLLASFGRAGEGPGEIATPYGVIGPTADDSLVRVWSPGRAVISAFHEDGTFAGVVGPVAMSEGIIPNWMDKVDYIRVRPLSRWNERYLVQDVSGRVGELTSVAEIANARLLVVSASGRVVDTLVEFRTLSGPTRPVASVMYMAAVPVWTTCANGTAVLADPYGMKLIRYSAAGTIARTDTLPLDAPRITDDDIRRHLRHWSTVREITEAMGAVPTAAVVEETIAKYLGPERANVATFGPPAARMLCDETGQLWLQRYSIADEPRGLGRDWVVVADDRIVARYRFPARFQPMLLSGGTAYGVQRDSVDVERVASVRYDLASGGTP